MSHFVIATIVPADKDLESVMAPFDEGLEVPQYVEKTKEQAIEAERKSIADYKASTYDEFVAGPQAYATKYGSRQEHLDYLRYDFPKRLTWTDEELYAQAIRYEEPENIDADGGILSTYNPQTIWDWYTIGGRWTGEYGDDVTTPDAVATTLADPEKAKEYGFPRIIIDAEGTAHRRGREGWFGFTEDHVDEETWLATVKAALDSAPAGSKLYFIDCHI